MYAIERVLAQGLFVDLDKNLANTPIARDAHRKATSFVNYHGRQVIRLPGEDQVSLIFSEHDGRLIHAFDFNVLCLIGALAKFTGSETVDLKSAKAVLTALGYSWQHTNIKKVKNALDLLSRVQIRFDSWYDFETHKHRKRTLPPPISFPRGTKRFRVEVHPTWLWIFCESKYVVRLPLPLPRDATTLNCLLLAAAWPYTSKKSEQATRLPDLYRKVGLVHSQRLPKFKLAQERVKQWVESHRGKYAYGYLQGCFWREMKLPPVPRQVKSPKAPIVTKPVMPAKPERTRERVRLNGHASQAVRQQRFEPLPQSIGKVFYDY